VPSDGNARSGVNEFESIFVESLVDEEDLGFDGGIGGIATSLLKKYIEERWGRQALVVCRNDFEFRFRAYFWRRMYWWSASKNTEYWIRAFNLGVAIKDWLTASQVATPSGWEPGPIVTNATAYEGTKAQYLGKGDVAYFAYTVTVFSRKTSVQRSLFVPVWQWLFPTALRC
jgi:hypothetical protein